MLPRGTSRAGVFLFLAGPSRFGRERLFAAMPTSAMAC
jgi:hypothetical protein